MTSAKTIRRAFNLLPGNFLASQVVHAAAPAQFPQGSPQAHHSPG
jgi:hypothetical protein